MLYEEIIPIHNQTWIYVVYTHMWCRIGVHTNVIQLGEGHKRFSFQQLDQHVGVVSCNLWVLTI